MVEDEAHTVPDSIRFAELAKEMTAQETKVMYGMASCPYGPIYFKFFDISTFVDSKGNKRVGQRRKFSRPFAWQR